MLARGDASHFVPIGSMQPRSLSSSQTDERSRVLLTMILVNIRSYSVFNPCAHIAPESLAIVSNDRQRMLLRSPASNEQ